MSFSFDNKLHFDVRIVVVKNVTLQFLTLDTSTIETNIRKGSHLYKIGVRVKLYFQWNTEP